MMSKTTGMQRLREVVPEKTLGSVPDVLAAMDTIEPLLEPAGLGHVVPFNNVYKRLTGEVTYGVHHDGIFEQPDVVEHNVRTFAQFYFDPLRYYLDGNPRAIAAPWQRLFYGRAAKSATNGIQFALGMNAHINYDLAQSLAATKVTYDYYRDYKIVVGGLIDGTSREISSDYLQVPELAQVVIRKFAVHSIAIWRNNAFSTGQKLQKLADDPRRTQKVLTSLERSSDLRSQLILRAGGFALSTLQTGVHANGMPINIDE